MNKNIKLSVAGLHMAADNEDASLESVYEAEYFKRNNSHYILYEEVQEGFDLKIKTRIKCGKNLVELTRQGLVRTQMIFEQNKKHITQYATPYGEILLGIATRQITLEEQEHCLTVTVEYALEADGEHLSDCRIVLRAVDSLNE